MFIGKIGAKGFLLTLFKTLSWGSVFPLDYEENLSKRSNIDILFSNTFRFVLMVGLGLSLFFFPIALINFKKNIQIDAFYICIVLLFIILVGLLSFITCCENPRMATVFFPLAILISIINFIKLLKSIRKF